MPRERNVASCAVVHGHPTISTTRDTQRTRLSAVLGPTSAVAPRIPRSSGFDAAADLLSAEHRAAVVTWTGRAMNMVAGAEPAEDCTQTVLQLEGRCPLGYRSGKMSLRRPPPF